MSGMRIWVCEYHLSNPQNATPGANPSLTLTIEDNDGKDGPLLYLPMVVR